MHDYDGWSIMNILTMNNLTINKIIIILFPCILAIGIISLIIKRKILAKSIFYAILISGILILINFICPFLSIKTNYSSDDSQCHGIFLPGYYEDETIDIGLFGIDTINITSGEYEDVVTKNIIAEHHSTKKIFEYCYSSN